MLTCCVAGNRLVLAALIFYFHLLPQVFFYNIFLYRGNQFVLYSCCCKPYHDVLTVVLTVLL